MRVKASPTSEVASLAHAEAVTVNTTGAAGFVMPARKLHAGDYLGVGKMAGLRLLPRSFSSNTKWHETLDGTTLRATCSSLESDAHTDTYLTSSCCERSAGVRVSVESAARSPQRGPFCSILSTTMQCTIEQWRVAATMFRREGGCVK